MLIDCPECGRQVSDVAQSCPHCGYPIVYSVKQTSSNASVAQSSGAQTAHHSVAQSGLNGIADSPEYQQHPAVISKPQAKKKGCFKRALMLVLFIVVLVFAIAIMSTCAGGAIDRNSLWYTNLSSVMQEAGLGEVGRIDTTVTLRAKDQGGKYKSLKNGRAYRDFENDEILNREATITTESGRVVRANFYDNERVYKLIDADSPSIVYWALPDSDGDYTEDVVSFQSGDIVHSKNEEKAAQHQEQLEEYQAEQAAKPRGAEKAFVDGMTEYYDWDEESARNAYDLLSELGCSGAEVLGGSMTSNENLEVIRAVLDGHQINITAEDKVVFYVQITGWSEQDYGWFVNWRGKLKYGLFDKKLSFDLYDSETVPDGYIAYYNKNDDSVVPWSEK